MRTIIRLITMVLLITAGISFSPKANAQSVIDPSDPVITYVEGTNPVPAQPSWGNIGKWVRKKRLNWNTDSYKCYIYKNMAFRLKFPKSYNHNAPDGKKYPMLIFMHGLGEGGTIYDNEYSLYHGGEFFRNSVDNGTFDGFILVGQSAGYWGEGYNPYFQDIINYMAVNNKLDPFQISVNGLSGGGQGCWLTAIGIPTYISAILPMCHIEVAYSGSGPINSLKYTPIWYFQGALDPAPSAFTAQNVRDAYLAQGSNFRYTEYPNLAHGIWNDVWQNPDFFPFINRAYQANPWALTGRTEFCPGDPISATIGVAPGFDEYQWRKNGDPIAGANGNSIQVSGTGAIATYTARVRRGSFWSDWSRTPLQIKIKAPTVSPPISVDQPLMSKVIPALDANNGVTLGVPAGYTSYLWEKVGSAGTLSTTRTLQATTPGQYRVKVTEQFGCSSDFSTPFTVIDANGPNKPDAPINLIVTTLSKTSLKLDWSDNPSPAFNETNFEVYRAKQPEGPYTLISFKNADVLSDVATGLDANTTYYFKVRATNNTGASAASNVGSAKTAFDNVPPTSPTNLSIVGSTRTSISLGWTASTDDVAVTKYDVFVNGVKSYVTTNTTFTAYNLVFGQSYNFAVRAQDLAGNLSPLSNQVTGQALFTGLNYKYYTFTGTWNNLPNFTTLTPAATGTMPNVAITPRTQDDNFGFLWEGYINIPVTGDYYFRTNSDDGSRLWLGARNTTGSPYSFSGTPVVNNDGLHGTQDVTSVKQTLTAGSYPIAMAFYEQGGGEAMTVSWSTPSSGGSFSQIPNSAFSDAPVVNGTAPAKPTTLTATAVSFKQINLQWADNSNNETGFEIWRKTASTAFATIATVGANKTTYADSALEGNTKYYYRVRAIGQYGESAFDIENGNGTVNYAYYENGVTNLSVLPNFDALTPKKTGVSNGFDMSVRDRNDQFAFKYTGKININTSGSYTFYTSSDDGSKLYIDGFDEGHRVVNNDGLHGTQEASGVINLSAGVHDIYVTFFERDGGEVLEVRYAGPGVSKQLIPASALGDPFVNATTLPLPAAPPTPASLLAGATSSSRIAVSWTDVANETSYELFRSSTTNGNYLSFAVLPANTTSFQDTSLFGNAIYYYKVRAVNVGGPSAFSNEDSAKTLNSIPVLTSIENQYMRFGTQLQLAINATDSDNENLALSFTGLPDAFTVFTPTGNGKGILSFNNPPSAQASYPITVTVTDLNSGSTSQNFTLVIGDNYSPVVNSQSTVTLNEKQTSSVTLTATDQNPADVLTWSFANLPGFITPVTLSGNSVQLNLAPGYADNGTYTILARVDDGANGMDTMSFVLNVNDVVPNTKTYINFTYGTYLAPAPWNNTNKQNPSLNDNFPNFKDESGTVTSVGLQITSPWQNVGNAVNDLGVNTGNNSGIYPDNVIRTCYFTTSPIQTMRVYGLDPATTYSFTFFGSRGAVADNRNTTYTIGSTSVTLNAASNSQNTVNIQNVQPAADGSIVLSLRPGTGSSYGYLNAMVIEKTYNDFLPPAKPRNLTAELNGAKVKLTWTDAAYSETGYEIYRAASAAGPFTQLPTTGSTINLQQYVDSTILGNATYYYAVRAINNYGSSPYSDTVGIATPNVNPVVNPIADVKMKTDQVVIVPITVVDDPSDIITLNVTGLPSFATFTPTGNGTGTITIAPGSTTGVFSNIKVTATDDKNGSSFKQFSITIADKNVTKWYVNFNGTTYPVGSPWNNFNSQPNAGVAITNIKDELGSNTPVSVTLVDKWENVNDLGATTGNNSGAFPDDVMRTNYFESATATRRIKISGLATTPGLKYTLTLFGSRGGAADTRTTIFTYNGVSVTLNASNNTSNVARLQAIVPNASGEIEFTAQKASSSSYAYLAALVIESYIDNGIPMTPAALTATPTKTTIKLNWQDKSNNEDGFELYRATQLNGTYTLVNTTSANATSFEDNTVQAGQVYFYKLRGKRLPSFFTPYTNVASASTITMQVFVNFNDANPAGAPWNNTNNAPIENDVYTNFINDASNPTGINLTVLGKGFSGVNTLGMNTGNNSGIYPDNVLRSTWWLDVGGTGILRIDGLDQSKTYSFVFFGSRDVGAVTGDRTTRYSVGDRSVLLNVANNISNTAELANIKPDENGSVEITINAALTSAFGYIGSLVIRSYTIGDTDGDDGGSGALVTSATARTTSTAATAPAAVADRITPAISSESITGDNTVITYPNPFTSNLTLRLSLEKDVPKISIRIVDALGRTAFVKEFANVQKGNMQYQLNSGIANLPTGIYYLQVLGMPDNKNKTIKIVKRN